MSRALGSDARACGDATLLWWESRILVGVARAAKDAYKFFW